MGRLQAPGVRRPVTRSEVLAKLEIIAAPAVPNVEIVRLDSQLRKIPNSSFRPWETYDFAKEVVADRWNETREPVMSFTEEDLKAYIAAAVADAARGNNMPNKGGRPRKVVAA